MTLRSRLAWAFSAMLLVPLALLFLIGALVRWWWDPAAGADTWSLNNEFRAVGVLNTELRQDPLALLDGAGFDRLAAALPRGVSMGTWSEDRWVRTTEGFFDTTKKLFHTGGGSRTLFTWEFEAAPGREARLEVRWTPKVYMGEWSLWALMGFLGMMTILIGTNATLTWLVSRAVLRPLRQLEAAARRLGEGDLEPGSLPKEPPEFRRVGLAFDELRSRLKESLLERQALEEERRTWVASVSHDLRTPLAVIRGYAEGLRDGIAPTPEKQSRYHGVILERALQMERQVDDLFQWARWDWGQPQLKIQELDLIEELRAALTTWSTDWPELEVTSVPLRGSRPLKADPVALRRIFDNLVRNIVQHAGPYPRLHLSFTEGPSGCDITFRDEGPGLSPEVLPKVFDRFFRGDPARNPAQGGGGLGLTIARTLARSLGGEVTASNHPEGGAVFTVTLP